MKKLSELDSKRVIIDELVDKEGKPIKHVRWYADYDLCEWAKDIIKEAQEVGDVIFGDDYQDAGYENLIVHLMKMFELKECDVV